MLYSQHVTNLPSVVKGDFNVVLGAAKDVKIPGKKGVLGKNIPLSFESDGQSRQLAFQGPMDVRMFNVKKSDQKPNNFQTGFAIPAGSQKDWIDAYRVVFEKIKAAISTSYDFPNMFPEETETIETSLNVKVSGDENGVEMLDEEQRAHWFESTKAFVDRNVFFEKIDAKARKELGIDKHRTVSGMLQPPNPESEYNNYILNVDIPVKMLREKGEKPTPQIDGTGNPLLDIAVEHCADGDKVSKSKRLANDEIYSALCPEDKKSVDRTTPIFILAKVFISNSESISVKATVPHLLVREGEPPVNTFKVHDINEVPDAECEDMEGTDDEDEYAEEPLSKKARTG